MTKKVTIRDVAKAAGVSIYTVSCVLNGKGRISAATRRKVREVVGRLNYDPLKNMPLARNLSAKTIALLLPEASNEDNPFFSRAISTARKFASQHDCDIKLFSPTNLETRLEHKRKRAVSLGFDGLVLFCCDLNPACIRAVAEQGLPVALVRRHMDIGGIVIVTDSDAGEIRLAMEHLHAVHGHAKIGLVSTFFRGNIPTQRLEGYYGYIRDHGLSENPRLLIERTNPEYSAENRAAELYRSGEMTAMICFDDNIAIDMSQQLLRRGIRVPEDVAVVGINNDPLAEMFHPKITSVNVPVEKMVAAAFHSVLNYDPAIASDKALLRFDNELVIRESCGCQWPPE